MENERQIEEKYICPRCGRELHLTDEPMPIGEDEVGYSCTEYEMACDYCGIRITAYKPKEEREEPMSVGPQGFGNCPFCDSNLFWNCDYMRSEIYGEEYEDENDDSLVQCVTCPTCGAQFEVVWPSPNEEPNIPIYQEEEKEKSEA